MPLLFITPLPSEVTVSRALPAEHVVQMFPNPLQAESSELFQTVQRVWADILAFCLMQRRANSYDSPPQRCRWQQAPIPWWWYVVKVPSAVAGGHLICPLHVMDSGIAEQKWPHPELRLAL